MKTHFSKNWTEISKKAIEIKNAMPEGSYLHEYLSDMLMRERMLSRSSADEVITRLENGVNLFYTHGNSASGSQSVDVDSIIETVAGNLPLEDKREFLLNMLVVEHIRVTIIPEMENLVDFCHKVKTQISDCYGGSEAEVTRMKDNVLSRISGIIDNELKLDEAIQLIDKFKNDKTVIDEVSVISRNKEDSLIYAVSSYLYFSSDPDFAEENAMTPEVIGSGAAFNLAAAEAIKNHHSGLISKEMLHTVLKALYKVFFVCLLAYGAYLLFAGVAAISVYSVAMCFTFGSFWGILALIAAAYFVTSSVEYIFSMGQGIWEWGENGYEKICGYFNELLARIRAYCKRVTQDSTYDSQQTSESQITPEAKVVI